MPYRNEVQPLNLFGDYIAGRQAAISQQAGQQTNALRGLQVQQQQGLNALGQNPQATPEQYIRAGDAQTGGALANVQQQGQQDKQQALSQLANLAAKALTITDPAQRKGFLQQAGQVYGGAFQALGADMAQFPAMLQMPDADLEQKLRQVAQFAQARPEDAYTLKPGEKRFQGSREVASVASDNSITPYQQAQLDIERQKLKQGSPNQDFQKANTLRDEFNTQIKDYSVVQAGYQNIVQTAKAPSAAGDIALLTSFMKMIDPGSTVREGEFATAQNAAGIPAKIAAKYNQLLNGERLTADTRQDFVNQAKNLFEGRDKQYKVTRKRYENQAKRYNLNPVDVVGEEANAFDSSSAPAQEIPEGSTATGPGGKQIVMRNGQWVPL